MYKIDSSLHVRAKNGMK
jgi:phage terminase small subunit